MRIKTVIIDDEPIALEKLKNYVTRMPALDLVGSFGNPVEAMQYVYDNEVNLIITDINMPDLNGLDMIKTIRKKPMVIFTTAYPEYAIEGYKVSAVGYLLKPYGFNEFVEAVNRSVEIFDKDRSGPEEKETGMEDSIFVKMDHRFVRVDQANITYIKGYGEYLQIYIIGQSSPIVTLSSFSALKERLSDNFMQVHRSYVVNMNKVMLVEKSRIKMIDGTEIPVGDVYKNELQAYLTTRSIGKIVK